jgi:hypothetical protein
MGGDSIFYVTQNAAAVFPTNGEDKIADNE